MWTIRSPTLLHPHLSQKPHASLFSNISSSISSNGPPLPSAAKTHILLTCSFKPYNQNHLIQTLSKRKDLKKALQLLSQEPNPTQRTYEYILLACTQIQSFALAKVVHQHLAMNGLDQDSYLATKLINMYSHFNSVDDALRVFEETRDKTIYVWNAILRALALAGKGHEGLLLYQQMKQSKVCADRFTYTFVLKACCVSRSSVTSLLQVGKEIHGHILRDELASHIHIATTLADMYAEFGAVSYARRVFDGMSERNVVSWSAMIACYAKNHYPFEALELFHEMITSANDIVPNAVTMVSVLQACGMLAALGQGKVIHAYVLRRGLTSTLSVPNALVSMYSKCGSLELGKRLFGQMSKRDTVSWNSMISGYGIHGYGKTAIDVFSEMVEKGVSPNRITFVSVLCACSHVGLVEEGKRLFHDMVHIYKTFPSAEHYACMVDLLGRAGQLDEAAKMVEMMRIEPGPTVWGSLLGACRIHGNVDLAERASKRLFVLEPTNAGNYVLLADIYASAQMWEDVTRVKNLLEARGLYKIPGCSFIELKGKVYSFISDDEFNPHIEQLHALLVELSNEMKERGYVPDIKVVLYDLNRDEKEQILLSHSEKLALAFGLINTNNGEPIRITQNLRLCKDCHSFSKFISKYMRREILVRDVNRFHHFKDGLCSCGEYW
ncbi:pentatricopeptide repeat-containing protein CRR2, chloroplastic [Aristolochia californica]|uniref:pentatricopeptide repeat-containing protein CRR2, chloroplastic n=1 Tax=Aristolochia californica TaxID=171875 RepID=UPI0035D55D87